MTRGTGWSRHLLWSRPQPASCWACLSARFCRETTSNVDVDRIDVWTAAGSKIRPRCAWLGALGRSLPSRQSAGRPHAAACDACDHGCQPRRCGGSGSSGLAWSSGHVLSRSSLRRRDSTPRPEQTSSGARPASQAARPQMDSFLTVPQLQAHKQRHRLNYGVIYEWLLVIPGWVPWGRRSAWS